MTDEGVEKRGTETWAEQARRSLSWKRNYNSQVLQDFGTFEVTEKKLVNEQELGSEIQVHTLLAVSRQHQKNITLST